MPTDNIYSLETQIKRIEINILKGKAKNIFAAKNKIKSLKKRLNTIKQHQYLAQ